MTRSSASPLLVIALVLMMLVAMLLLTRTASSVSTFSSSQAAMVTARRIYVEPSVHILRDHIADARRMAALDALRMCDHMDVWFCHHPEHGQSLMAICRLKGTKMCAVGFISTKPYRGEIHRLITVIDTKCNSALNRVERFCLHPVDVIIEIIFGAK